MQRSLKVILLNFFLGLSIIAPSMMVISSASEFRTKAEQVLEHRKNVDQIHKWMSVYNPKTTWKEAEDVEKVITDNGLQEWRWELVSQLCVESGASQMSRKTGKVKESHSGALGIAQITPTTAFHILRYGMGKEERLGLEKKGASSTAWIDQLSYEKSEDGRPRLSAKARRETSKWLGDRENNLILWGEIMRRYKERYQEFDRAAVAYARGEGGLRRHEESFSSSDHIYSKHVDRVLEKLSELPS